MADLNGAAAQDLARKYGAAAATTDYKQVLADPAVNAVLIAVGHSLHARFIWRPSRPANTFSSKSRWR